MIISKLFEKIEYVTLSGDAANTDVRTIEYNSRKIRGEELADIRVFTACPLPARVIGFSLSPATPILNVPFPQESTAPCSALRVQRD